MRRGRGSAALLLLLLCGTAGILWAGSQAEADPAAASAGPQVSGPRRSLRIGTQPISNLDPHLATAVADIQILEQVYEHLTKVDARGRPSGELASEWETADGRTWIFTIREGARFSGGKLVTAGDVVYSFQRLRDPQLGAPVAGLLNEILEVQAVDARRVRFELLRPDTELPAALADYHAVILPASTRDPVTESAGSGPFAVAFYAPGEGVTLRRNPYYNLSDENGSRLPYLEELRFVFSSDTASQVQALREGRLDFVGGLTTEQATLLRRSRHARLLTVDANMHWIIHMRSDPGHVAADNRVRQALKLATNQQQLADALRPGLASVGNGFTPVGAAFGMYHLVRPPFPDTRKARRLLAEAGYPDGLEIQVEVPEYPEAMGIATMWKQQVARIGVTAHIRVTPVRTYFGTTGANWLNAEFGITDWGDRSSPLPYFKLAYTSGAPWNESHWSDPEFDQIVARIGEELDEGERIRMYQAAQEILIERGPVIVPYFVKAVAGVNSDLQGLSLAPDWPRTHFERAHFE